jgi:hypothetical protein
VIEVTEYNNRAQSNYDKYISAKSSPATREIATVKVHNPYPQSARVNIRLAKSSNPLYRTYIEHTWVTLFPGETRNVEVMFEYSPTGSGTFVPQLEQFIDQPAEVSVYATIEQPMADLEQAAVMLGGFTAKIVTGRGTRFDEFWKRDENAVYGRIVASDDGTPVAGGSIILTINAGDEQRDTSTTMMLQVNQQGEFYTQVSEEWESADAFFIAPLGYTDCQSFEIFRESVRHPPMIEMEGEFGVMERERRG